MKYKDVVEFSLFYLKKHKLRFLLNTITATIVIAIIFTLFSLCASILVTVDKDLDLHIQENNNQAVFTLNGTQNGRKYYSVTEQEIVDTKDVLSRYGEVEIKEEIRFNDLAISIGSQKVYVALNIMGLANSHEIVAGEEWNSDIDSQNYLWVTSDIFNGIKTLNSSFEIGDDLTLKVDDDNVTFKIMGIVEGRNGVFAGKSYLINSNIAYVSYANFYLTLPQDNVVDNVKKLDKTIESFNKGLDNDSGAQDRLSNFEINHYRNISTQVGLYNLCIFAIVLFLTVLIVGVLKNNSVINIFDNIEAFSIMRCLGMNNRQLMHISLTESYLNIVTSCVVGSGVSIALFSVVRLLANKILASYLIKSTVAAYDSAWWTYIVFCIVLLLLTTIYFSLTLSKSLKRKNLLKTLKGE